ncbi:hypothetical protein LCGC14_0598850 [marine sediment metagenome]|uniref:Phage ABA sandwich domain-containing protein n=1 Tax=marine sediment metagenome TaxID=412755 RepID=A0A0F9RV26_9ZZZZ
MKELNKKLAEWRFGKDGVTYGHIIGETLVIYRRTKWIEVDEEWGIEVLEVFTESLDACFKWLVPKAVRLLGNTDLSSDEEAMFKLLGFSLKEFWTRRPMPVSPALALCLAIEKIIDKE